MMSWDDSDLELLPERIQRQARQQLGGGLIKSKPRAAIKTGLSEKDLALKVAKHLQTNHPDVIYRFDLAADLRLTMGQAKRNKEIHPLRGYPDLAILQPMHGYPALFVELKIEGKGPYLKDGYSLKKDPHIEEQNSYLERLKRTGYYADFSVGFDEAIGLIDAYLNPKSNPIFV